MSRSTDLAQLSATILTATLAVTTALPAQADAPPVPHVNQLVAHVYPLHANTRDTAGATRTSSTPDRVDATVAADVAFGKDSATLTPPATQALDRLAVQLDKARPGTLNITGYTDNLGTHAYGIDLSTRRAQAVHAHLGDLPHLKVEVKGLAEADPVAPNTTETNRARNRRVEIHYQAR